ncbi:SHPRH.2 family protein [Megaselia abdita]
MGMGKTVEMLALFLHHPNPNIIKDMPDILNDQDELPLKRLKYVRCICGKDRKRRKKLIECLSCGTSSHLKCVAGKSFEKTLENYICPECWELQETLLDSKTTLIVSPKSIMGQWKSEIKRHISNDWKILIYEKIDDHFYISPLDLVQYDIVIIDFSVLRSELYFDIDNSCRMNRRNESRTMRLLSPLTKINWWRICMDEAQMVSSVKTKTYQMVDKLSCVNKWAVSGTPIHKSIDDLLVHMNLFNLSPLSGAKNFQRLVFDYRNGTNMILVEYLQKLMWRISKDQVKDQLNLPENNEVVHFVSFSNIMFINIARTLRKITMGFVPKEGANGDDTNNSILFYYQNVRSVKSEKKLSSLKGDTTEFWKFIKNKNSSSSFTKTMTFDHISSSSEESICDMFTDFFQRNNCDTNDYEVPEFYEPSVINLPVIQTDLNHDLKCSYFPGPDGVLTNCCDSLIDVLCYLFNLSLKSSIFSSC